MAKKSLEILNTDVSIAVTGIADPLEEVLINQLDLFGLELEQKKKLLQTNINLME